ncbi:hypothetical protein GYMLUDRAFT_242513 [Collybiopsis luxurians FD-317 M1]|uniref:Uncharacterized protein n=1 Tax=Collybiopsis luxurians FD-317 M1 TaxID=944289 RepID=A0A0D0C3Y1_9AGAR|nr:hypothetical protein GYMLUDRAFT_242513 [Collybiopsis luxurians FD-317 M1]
MAFRAYVLQNNVSVDSSRPVTIEELSALGLKVVIFNDSQDPEQAARKLVQEWGYPLEKDCVVPFDFRQDAANSPEVKILYLSRMPDMHSYRQISNLLAQLVQLIENPTFAFPVELAGFVSYSSMYLDVEDIKSKRWIRIYPGPGQLYRASAGLKIRVPLTDQNRNHFGTVFCKNGVSSIGIIPEKDLDNHAARQVYLNSIEMV